MPAVYAHYKFGKFVYKALPKEIQQIIKENKPAYLLGLHGPDLLFYYRPIGKNRVNQQGVRMHNELASTFFEKARKRYQERPNRILLSYLCGFLCHFMLDSECHPYINSYMKIHHLGHLEIETDFDRYLMEVDHLDPTRHNCTCHLVRDWKTEKAIASVYENVTARQIDACILGFRFCIRAFQCPGKRKAKFFETVSAITRQKRDLGGLIMTGIPNPKCGESREILKERLGNAVAPTIGVIQEYVSGIDTSTPLSSRLEYIFS
jgi:hypothetical protein